MISSLLKVAALLHTFSSAFASLTAAADDSCALYLNGPGRTSAYDYRLNLLKGNFGYEGQHTCITYDAINQAYLDARNRILVSQPKGDWKAEDFASVGELMLDISINLARTYGLTYEEIEKGLPLIDTSRTLIREVCPPVFSHVECRAGKYRRFDGLCNNLRHPTWGATMAPFQRLIGPLFADGINAPRIAHNGHDLPLSRVVSRTMHPDDGFHDHAGTVMVIAWGQFMDHDYTLTGTPLDPINRNDPEECCKRPPHLKHPYCNEIRVPDDDYFYRLWGVKCIDFVRGFPSPRPSCRLGSRVPFNTLTGSIDGNTVYGVTEKFARKLRTGYGGLLRMNPVFKEYGLKDLLPLKLDIPDEGCTRPNKNMYCFEAGEIRVNEQLVLTVMHTLMAREHNRVAEGLAAVNPHWDDETLFQEARRINIAEIQHITYNEFLPILLGKDVMEKFGLVLKKEGYWNGYDPEVNPDVLASFAAAAYRFGHSLLPTAVERWSKAHKFIASKRLSDLIRRPYDLYRAGVLDEYVMGLMNQVAQAMDDSITQEVTNHLFKKVGARFGMDLVSFNMQRGREFGLPGYMEFRKFCGLSGADTFQDLFGSMPNETVRKYESIFDHPIDVDLWSGGVSERPLPGSMLGPTFACIIATQFSYSRRGDRFWFELPNQPSSFTPEQLAEIKKSRLARVICDNTDIIDTVQLYPMVLPDHELNPRVPCRSGIIPSMDFSKWAEPVPFHGTAKQFITDAVATNYIAACNDYVNETSIEKESPTQKQENYNIDIVCDEPVTSPIGIVVENTTSNQNINQTAEILLNEDQNEVNIPSDCKEENIADSNMKNDKVLIYVYNESDKANVAQKSKGHSKNSISRKKRSPEIEPNFYPKRILPDYYTAPHDIKEREEINQLHDKDGNVIKKADLADFNIETLHQGEKFSNDKSKKSLIDIETSRVHKENNVSYYPKETDKLEPTINESNESDSKENNDSRENTYDKNDKSSHIKQTENSSDSSERPNSSINHQKDKESTEIDFYHKNVEKDDSREIKNKNDEDSYERNKSVENSDESYFVQRPKPDKEEYKETPVTSTPRSLQDVDLGDFSYERIRVNSKGQVEPTKELQENDGSGEIIQSTSMLPKPNKLNEKVIEQYAPLTIDFNSSAPDDENKNQPIRINDGEVKPVVELNNEDDTSSSSEESSKEFQNSQLKTPTNYDGSSEEQQKSNNDAYKKVDVKQEFERIPLNYNHDSKLQKDIKTTSADKSTKVTSDENDGTIDALTTPKAERYDENLNIKFGDVSINLPEIQLPDDILSYARIGTPENNEKSNTFYQFGEDDSEDDLGKRSHDAGNNENYYTLYNDNQFERYKEPKVDDEFEDDDDVDLYEKFVRERFGKERKQLAKAQAEESKPANSKLLETVQKILKKTEKVQKEAEKSGDPNAGYLWTLEYGEDL